MRLPSKVTPYEASVLPRMVFIMNKLDHVSKTPAELYAEWLSQGLPACDFMETMDALFALGGIDVDSEGRLTTNAVRN